MKNFKWFSACEGRSPCAKGHLVSKATCC